MDELIISTLDSWVAEDYDSLAEFLAIEEHFDLIDSVIYFLGSHPKEVEPDLDILLQEEPLLTMEVGDQQVILFSQNQYLLRDGDTLLTLVPTLH